MKTTFICECCKKPSSRNYKITTLLYGAIKHRHRLCRRKKCYQSRRSLYSSLLSLKNNTGVYNPKPMSERQLHEKANRWVVQLVQMGKLKKAVKCCQCQSRKNIIGHHPDYHKPTNVIWMCQACHIKIHLPSMVKNRNLKHRKAKDE